MAEIVLTPGQRAAVESRGCALLVAAAAGSGKTRVLIDRVLDQVIREGRCVDEFLLITFTQAAAACRPDFSEWRRPRRSGATH